MPARMLDQAVSDAPPDLMRHVLSTVINAIVGCVRSGRRTEHPRSWHAHGASPDETDLSTFCRLEELRLEGVGQHLEPDRAGIACRVADSDQWCRRCRVRGPRDTVIRRFDARAAGLASRCWRWSSCVAAGAATLGMCDARTRPSQPSPGPKSRVAAAVCAGRHRGAASERCSGCRRTRGRGNAATRQSWPKASRS